MAGDGPRTLGQAGERGYANLEWEDDCAARESYAKAANLQFLAVERWLDVAYVVSPDCRARFFFVTSLREPLARYRSHLAFEHISEEDAVAWAEQLQVPRDDPIRRGTAVVDNFYVRSLLGREFFEFAAMRHRPPAEARAFRQAHSGTVFLSGLAIAGFLAVPFLNLLTPIFATVMMVHLNKRLTYTSSQLRPD